MYKNMFETNIVICIKVITVGDYCFYMYANVKFTDNF